MNIQKTMALIPLMLLPLTACQKYQADPSFKIKGSDQKEHALSFRLGQPWTRVSMTCAKSGKDLTQFAVSGSEISMAVSETLVFSRTNVVSTTTINSTAAGEKQRPPGVSVTTMNYVVKADDKSNVLMDTTITSINGQDMSDKFGISMLEKVGDKVESNYVATSSSLTLTRPSKDGECEDSSDQVISAYK